MYAKLNESLGEVMLAPPVRPVVVLTKLFSGICVVVYYYLTGLKN